MMPLGEYGGVTLRTLTRGAGIAFPPMTEISADMALSWPIANRQALSNSGIVRWHNKPIFDHSEDVSTDDETGENTETVADKPRRGRKPGSANKKR